MIDMDKNNTQPKHNCHSPYRLVLFLFLLFSIFFFFIFYLFFVYDEDLVVRIIASVICGVLLSCPVLVVGLPIVWIRAFLQSHRRKALSSDNSVSPDHDPRGFSSPPPLSAADQIAKLEISESEGPDPVVPDPVVPDPVVPEPVISKPADPDAVLPGIISSSALLAPRAPEIGDLLDYVVFDVETTGLNRSLDRIVEIGIIKVAGGNVVDSFSSLVNPGIPIPSAASRVNGISDSDVSDAPAFSDIFNSVCSYFFDVPVFAHNASFDIAFISKALSLCGVSGTIRYYDSIALAKLAYPGLKSYSLSNLIGKLGISSSQDHRALSDAQLTQKVIDTCRQKMMDDYAAEMSRRATATAERKFARERAAAVHTDRYSWSSFCDKRVVFVGTLSLGKDHVSDVTSQVGARVYSSVNTKTDFLVSGNPSTITQQEMDTIVKKALNLSKAGKKIKIISENDYMKMLLAEMDKRPILPFGVGLVMPKVEFSDPSCITFPRKTFVLTGESEKFSRDSLSNAIEQLGGRVCSTVSRSVDFVAVGPVDLDRVKDKVSYKTSKVKDAEDYASSGCGLKIVPLDALCDLISRELAK